MSKVKEKNNESNSTVNEIEETIACKGISGGLYATEKEINEDIEKVSEFIKEYEDKTNIGYIHYNDAISNLYLLRGFLHDAIGDNEESINDFGECIESSKLSENYKNKYKGFICRGIEKFKLKKYPEAMKDFDGFVNFLYNIERKGRDNNKFYDICDSIKKGKFKGIIDDEDIQNSDDEDACLLYALRGIAYFKNKENRQAKNDFDKVIKFDFNKRDYHAYEDIVEMYLTCDEISVLEVAMNYAKKVTNSNLSLQLEQKINYYRLYLEMYKCVEEKKWDDALKYINKALKNKNKSLEDSGNIPNRALFLLVKISILIDQYDELEKENSFVEVRNKKLEEASETLDKLSEKVKEDEKFLRSKIYESIYYKDKMEICIRQKKYDEAIIIYEEELKDLDDIKTMDIIVPYIRALYKLGDKGKDNNEFEKFAKHLEKTRTGFLRYVAKEMESLDFNDKDKLKLQICYLYVVVCEMKERLRYNGKDNCVAHYTKINNLKYLVKPKKVIENNGKTPYIRLNNVAYMNDPTEGKVFLKLLKNTKKEVENIIKDLYNTRNCDVRKEFNDTEHVYLTSFSEAIDTSLPMWVGYSQDATGCCLLYSIDDFDKEDLNSDAYNMMLALGNEDEKKENNKDSYCLYNIKYIDEKQLNNKKEEAIKSNLEEIAEILLKMNHLNDDKVKSIVKNILAQVRYLFKDKDYSYEKEVRVVRFCTDEERIKYTDEKEGFVVPHAYIDLEKELKVREVILGPKVDKAMEIANYLSFSGVESITKSNISYQ